MIKYIFGIVKIFIVCVGFILSACGVSPKANFFHLQQHAGKQLTGIERGIAVGVGPVNVAQYLDRPQIVTRTGEHRIIMSEFNRWSEPLNNSISRLVAVSLSNQLQSTRIYLLPRRNKTITLDYQVSIDIPRFDGVLGKQANLAARWTLSDTNNNVLLTKISIINESCSGPDFEHLVAAENKALQLLSEEIANAIKNQHKKD